MKFCVLGILGSIGQRHSANLQALGQEVFGYDPAGCADPEDERQRLIGLSDAVVVASPTKLHVRHIQDAMDANKHIFVEKPIGYDCPPFIAGLLHGYSLKNPDKIVATGFNLRFHQAVRHSKELLAEGMIGAVTAATFRVQQKSTKPIYLMDGVVRNWASHEIDLARFLLGDLAFEKADIDFKDGNDHAAKLFLSKKTVIIADYHTDPEARGYEIFGERGIIHVDLVKRTVRITREAETIYEYQATDTFDQNYIQEMVEFIFCCENGRAPLSPLATGKDGVEALEIVMAALGGSK